MKELFTGLYKKVAGFFQAAEEKENAKEVACNRLKFVLMQDRTNLNPYLLERLRSEMVDVLSKYVEMDKEALELSFEQEGESMALMLSIPVIRAKDEEEIQALIQEEEEAKAKAEEEASEESEEVQEEAEEAFEDEATETVDVESEAEEEDVCTCDDDEIDDEDEDEDDDDEDTTCGCTEPPVEESTSKKPKKK